MNLLTVTNLSAGYAGKQVIKDISFFVAPKTIVGILGANGCGKNTYWQFGRSDAAGKNIAERQKASAEQATE